MTRPGLHAALSVARNQSLDSIFIQGGGAFSFRGMGNLTLGESEASATGMLPLKRIYNSCKNSPAQAYSISGEEMGSMELSFGDRKLTIPSEFLVLVWEGRVSGVVGSGDYRFRTDRGIGVGSSLKDVRIAYQTPAFGFKETREGNAVTVEVIDQTANNGILIRVEMMEDAVTTLRVLKRGTKIQAHDCGQYHLI